MVGEKQKMSDFIELFKHTNPVTPASRLIELYGEKLADNSDVVEARRTLMVEGEGNPEKMLVGATDGLFREAKRGDYIKKMDSVELKNGVSVPRYYLTSKGWNLLVRFQNVNLYEWNNTIEVEPLEDRNFKLVRVNEKPVTCNTLNIPAYIEANVRFEDGCISVDPPEGYMFLVYKQTDDVFHLVSVVEAKT